MSYLVLARKWRPKRFAELVGQEHVVRALSNALETGRVHHAFLFTGTRGVGKTTIARIFAKSLNCERGAGAEPCGECNACLDIDAGRFVDLLEIDAASNTGVDDVRALIENAQYMPARGRTKVFLIDEVHMLSKNAFNALLKTLEEPPGHVKFLLATTDPQKLPVTVLSRCLQFNLRRLEPAQIGGQISRILAAEGIAAEPEAVALLARAADGSLRDGLSLLDQAIAHAGGALDAASVNAMLGTVERAQVGAVIEALADGDGAALLAEVEAMAAYSPDFGQVLEDLAIELHRLQLRQLVPGLELEPTRVDTDGLAARLSPEIVQLWYQMAVNGRRDIGYAPSARAGFEMSLLRMLAFRPDDGATGQSARAVPAAAGAPATAKPAAAAASRPALSDTLVATRVATPGVATPAPALMLADVAPPPSAVVAPSAVAPSAVVAPAPSAVVATAPESAPAPVTRSSLRSAEEWLDLVPGLGLKGPTLQLASHAQFIAFADGVLRLHLPAEDAHLRSDNTTRQLTAALAAALGTAPQLRFEAQGSGDGDTLQQRQLRARDARQQAAEAGFRSDPVVASLLAAGGSIVPDSIRPLPEN